MCDELWELEGGLDWHTSRDCPERVLHLSCKDRVYPASFSYRVTISIMVCWATRSCISSSKARASRSSPHPADALNSRSVRPAAAVTIANSANQVAKMDRTPAGLAARVPAI